MAFRQIVKVRLALNPTVRTLRQAFEAQRGSGEVATQMFQPIPPMGGYGDSGVEGETVPIHSERLRRARSLWCQRLRQSRIDDGERALTGLRALNQSALVHQLAQGACNDAIE